MLPGGWRDVIEVNRRCGRNCPKPGLIPGLSGCPRQRVTLLMINESTFGDNFSDINDDINDDMLQHRERSIDGTD
jgi:hypothetical protein